MTEGRRLRDRLVRPNWSLNFKLTLALVTAAVITIGVYFVATALEAYFAQVLFLSEKAKTEAVNEKYHDFRMFVWEKKVIPTDTDVLKEWVDDEHYTQLLIYDNQHDLFSAGYVVDTNDTSGLQNENSTLAANKEAVAHLSVNDVRIDTSEFTTDLYNRIVTFGDGKNYYVYINVNREKQWYAIMNVMKVLLAAIVFLLVVLMYNSSMLRRVIRLSEEVGEISLGDLQREIHPGADDEIGKLAHSVDDMRDSLLETMDKEKAAWDANAQLITAMSHDIRTPLTSLIGYLDIIDGKKFETEEELQKYISSCRDKAFQLKDLSDQLFRYFLVFGNPGQERPLEEMDAGILFQQILVEHAGEATSYGKGVQLDYTIPEGSMIRVDLSAVQRLFDNLFSNIMKYADSRWPVEIRAYREGNRVMLTLSNHIWEEAPKVESTQIGVKTCKRICEELHGTFHAIEEGNIYTTEVGFPVVAEDFVKEG